MKAGPAWSSPGDGDGSTGTTSGAGAGLGTGLDTGLDTEAGLGEECGVMKGEVAAAGLVSVLGEAAVAWSEAWLSVTASNPLTVPPSLWKAAAAVSLLRTDPSPLSGAAPTPTSSRL